MVRQRPDQPQPEPRVAGERQLDEARRERRRGLRRRRADAGVHQQPVALPEPRRPRRGRTSVWASPSRSDGRMYTTHNFMALPGGGAAAAAAASPATAAAADRRPAAHDRGAAATAAHHHDDGRRRRSRSPPRTASPRSSSPCDPSNRSEQARLATMTAAVETHDLTRSFPSGVALDGLTLDVQQGEVLALLGPNGAGKTTTVRLLNGILRPDRGRALVLGLDPTVDPNGVRRRTGRAHRARRARRAPHRAGEPRAHRPDAGPRPPLRGAAHRRAARALRHGRPRRRHWCRARRPASASGSRWRGRSCTIPTCCSSTSRRRGSTRRPPGTSSTSSARSPPSTAAPSCSARTSSARPGAWPTAWPCSTAASCTPSAGPRRSPRASGTASTRSSSSAARSTAPPPTPCAPAAACRWWRPPPTAPSCGWTTARSCRTSSASSWSAASTSTARRPRRRRSRTSTSRSRRASRPAACRRGRRRAEPAGSRR